MKTVKKNGKRLRVFRILGLAFMIAGVIIIANTISNRNEQIFESSILRPTIVAERQLTQEQITELKNEMQSQNIPIPEELKQKMVEEAKAKAEAERIAKERAEAEAKAKAEAEEKARLEAEQKAKEEVERQKEIRSASTQVTSRGGNTSRTNFTKTELQNYARDLCINTYGWSENDVNCVFNIVEKESSWNVKAKNSSSGAYGLFQSLPASKMTSEGNDYLTNGETQIRWGLKYIKERYGTPSNAWSFWQKHKWY